MMNALKVYQKVNAQESTINFEISRMEPIYTKRKGQPDVPHRHSFYTVLFIIKARGKHKVDFNTYELGEHQVFFVAPGQVHQLIEEKASEGYVLTFSHQFLIENSIPLSFIENLQLFQNYGQNPPLKPPTHDFAVLEGYLSEIFKFYSSQASMKNLSIGAFLKLFLIQCNNICSINPIDHDTDKSGDNLIRSFKKLVEEHYKKEHTSIFYAERLHITADYLNRTIKAKIGKTAKEYIQSRILTEAKRLLFFTQLSSKEIGYALGYNEPANFSAFFKKQTNLSPSSFKKRESQPI